MGRIHQDSSEYRKVEGKSETPLRENGNHQKKNPACPTKLLMHNILVRDHWGIENKNHYVRDVSFV